MKISVVGAGYVGLVSSACLASKGHQVVCVDKNSERVDEINNRQSPIHEKGLGELLEEVVPEDLYATTKLQEAVLESDVSFICVGTPNHVEGGIDLSQVREVTEGIGGFLSEKDGCHTVVVKSTVVPSTTREVVVPLLEESSVKECGGGFSVAVNPEFLREGRAVDDFLNPDRVVLGVVDEDWKRVMKRIYRDFDCPLVEVDWETAETIKYASNCFLATKLSFINELGNICKKMGVDVYDVAQGMGMDHRISGEFLKAGPGFGGSCFPKDVKALISKARELGEEPDLLECVLDVNQRQPSRVLDLIESRIDLEDMKVGVLGLSFKEGTDDMRGSPAVPVIEGLLDGGAQVVAYDPQAMENAKKVFGDRVGYASCAQEVVDESDALVVLTGWSGFKDLDYSSMGDKFLFDTRRVVDEEELPEGVRYEGLAW